MFDLDTQLIIAMLQQKSPRDKEMTPEKYDEKYRQQIKDAERLLTYLGLAEQCKKSAIGWKPTRLFIETLAMRVATPKAVRGRFEHGSIITMLCDAVFGEKYVGRGIFGLFLLEMLGLTRCDEYGWETTRELRGLFGEEYLTRKSRRAAANRKVQSVRAE